MNEWYDLTMKMKMKNEKSLLVELKLLYKYNWYFTSENKAYKNLSIHNLKFVPQEISTLQAPWEFVELFGQI